MRHVRGPLWDFYLTVCKIERDMSDEGVYHTPSCNIQIIKAPNIGGGERRGDRKTVFVLELTSNCPSRQSKKMIIRKIKFFLITFLNLFSLSQDTESALFPLS